ncbi:rRNA maturation RNase YbeY [Moraxella sp. Tifton1]|uniref:rRNA maturation RNase YbeY n=1 Tax=Moraxella oculi TaxID=2940516 RepID=UPI002011162B|nr:rRNA maturation RNase YbeY [Moraxella sp. Tifton1]MCL1622661.1 rRNA maturation RNase YbeY [Moraxella sp. Tifton1]
MMTDLKHDVMADELCLSFSDALPANRQSEYNEQMIHHVFTQTLDFMSQKHSQGLVFAYFNDADKHWHKPKSLDIYITDTAEARELNFDARGKDYATNVLSYPTDLPGEMLDFLPKISLGELILCDAVVAKEAAEQGKSFEHHLMHLIIHGILHLLGFDHEISDTDADEMEGFEIEILAKLGINNPYQT